jgi:hypothetical protein
VFDPAAVAAVDGGGGLDLDGGDLAGVVLEQRLVAVRRAGRHEYYRLFDHHLPDLLAALRNHYRNPAKAGLTFTDVSPAQPPRSVRVGR